MGTRVHYSEVVTKPHLIDLVEDDWLLDTLPDDAIPLPAHAQLPLADDDELGAVAGAASAAPPAAQRQQPWHEMALHELG